MIARLDLVHSVMRVEQRLTNAALNSVPTTLQTEKLDAVFHCLMPPALEILIQGIRQPASHIMKLVRYGKLGRVTPGLIDSDGLLPDLRSVLPDIGPSLKSRWFS